VASLFDSADFAIYLAKFINRTLPHCVELEASSSLKVMRAERAAEITP
jgi:hypothetical protein